MQKIIPSSFIGYDKQVVNRIIKEKDKLLETQSQDINYLRNENLKLKKQIKKQKIEEEIEKN